MKNSFLKVFPSLDHLWSAVYWGQLFFLNKNQNQNGNNQKKIENKQKMLIFTTCGQLCNGPTFDLNKKKMKQPKNKNKKILKIFLSLYHLWSAV